MTRPLRIGDFADSQGNKSKLQRLSSAIAEKSSTDIPGKEKTDPIPTTDPEFFESRTGISQQRLAGMAGHVRRPCV
jgi:hypothetical protein